MSYTSKIRKCDCESGLDRYALKDGYGIFLCYACQKCEEKRLSRYRPDIMSEYECDEPIEPDE